MPNDLQTFLDTATRGNGRPKPSAGPSGPFQPLLRQIARYWWVEPVAGILWSVIAVVVLKFDHASVVTVGVLTGLMFLLVGAEQFMLAALNRSTRWVWLIFGALMTVAGVVALSQPVSTFAGLADILGFVFLLIGVQTMVQAFMERLISDLWWLTLISGIVMVGLAFWVSGQFFLDRAYLLLVYAGIWAAMKGVTAIVRAFQIRRLGA